MEKIKIEVICFALFELRLENTLYLVHVGKVVSGELARKIKLVARIL